MADGRIWMVQDMKFGNLCNKTTFSGSNGADQTGKLSTAIGYIGLYGDCRSNTVSSAGYLYDWAAAIQKSGAYEGGSNVGCAGTSSGASCQGICPTGWHVPTKEEYDAAITLFANAYGCSGPACWDASSQWAGVKGGWCSQTGKFGATNDHAVYWSSTSYSLKIATRFYIEPPKVGTDYPVHPKSYGASVRCISN
jgi:uncharacterized protein (TIGR02145 family)